MVQNDSTPADETVSTALGPGTGLRCVLGGILMGLANLVPGISGGTMLLAVGIYRAMIEAIAGLAGAAFSYHRAVAPMLWVLLALMIIEAMVVHLLVALWHPWAALLLSKLSLALVGWFILFIRSLRRHPVRVDAEGLTWPIGFLRGLTVPWRQVAGLHVDWTLAELRTAGLFNGALIAHPNIVVALDPPVQAGRRSIRFLAHRLDEPSAFAALFSTWTKATLSGLSTSPEAND